MLKKWTLFLLFTALPLHADEAVKGQIIDAVGDVEEEEEVAGRLERDAPTLYDRNKWEVERQRRQAARRAWRKVCEKRRAENGECVPQPATEEPSH